MNFPTPEIRFVPPNENCFQGYHEASAPYGDETVTSGPCGSESTARAEFRAAWLRREGKPQDGEARRTVWTWSIAYAVKLSSGPIVERRSDGGPYCDRETAIAAAHSARGQLMDMHGNRNVGRYELRTHEARTSQPMIEESFPEKIEELKQRHPGLFTAA